MFSSSLLGISFDAALKQLKEEEEAKPVQQHNNNAASSKTCIPTAEVLSQEDLNNLFSKSNASFSETQERQLWHLFESAMLQTLEETHAAEKNNLVVLAKHHQIDASSASSSNDHNKNNEKNDHRADDGTTLSSDKNDNTTTEQQQQQHNQQLFPIYRKCWEDELTVILKDPQLLLRGPAADPSASGSAAEHRQVECDYAVLHLKGKISLGSEGKKKGGAAVRRGRDDDDE